MNKNTQALHEALVSLWRKLGEKTLLMLKEQHYEAVRKIVVDNCPAKAVDFANFIYLNQLVD